MRRSFIALGLLALLTLGTLTGAHLWVNAARDQLELRETVLVGNSADAAGVRATYRTQNRGGYLNWETVFTPGGAAETSFRFDAKGPEPDMSWVFEPYGELIYANGDAGFESYSGVVLSEVGSDLLHIMAAAVQERTSPGETRTESLPLNAYTAWYPLAFQAGRNGLSEFTDTEQNGWLARYFRLPVPPEQTVEVAVTKDDAGAVTAVSSRYSKDMPELWSESVVCAEGVYLIAGAWDEDGTDLLQCPDGPGIHFVPISEEEYPWFQLSRLRLFYPAEHALRLQLSEDESRLLLYTREEGRLVLTGIDRTSGQVLQRLELLEMGEGEALYPLIDRGPLHLTVLSGGDFCLVREEDGELTAVLTGRLDPDEVAMRQLIHNCQDLTWDGARMFWGASDWYNAYLGVWDSQGLQFLARYEAGPAWDPGWEPAIGSALHRSFSTLTLSLG